MICQRVPDTRPFWVSHCEPDMDREYIGVSGAGANCAAGPMARLPVPGGFTAEREPVPP